MEKSCGTRPYLAPEVLSHSPYQAEPSDIWSCGIILVSMLAGGNYFKYSNLYIPLTCCVSVDLFGTLAVGIFYKGVLKLLYQSYWYLILHPVPALCSVSPRGKMCCEVTS